MIWFSKRTWNVETRLVYNEIDTVTVSFAMLQIRNSGLKL